MLLAIIWIIGQGFASLILTYTEVNKNWVWWKTFLASVFWPITIVVFFGMLGAFFCYWQKE